MQIDLSKDEVEFLNDFLNNISISPMRPRSQWVQETSQSLWAKLNPGQQLPWMQPIAQPQAQK